MTIDIDEAVRRAVEAKSMLYNMKSWIPDDKRDQELRFLYGLATMAPDGIAVELGVHRGGSLLCWSCARVGRGPIIAVDNWESKTEAIFGENIARYNLDVQVITANSYDAPGLIEGQVSFLFDDAAHDETGIPKDILTWPDKILPGGIIAFHDHGTRKGIVGMVVDAWQSEARWELIGKVGSTIAFRRPNAET